LVVIAIIGILVALLLPAIQASREGARRAMCANNMRQLILAVQDYEMAHEHLPAGTINDTGPIKNLPKGHHISWIAQTLPYFEESALYANLDLSLSAYHHKNDRARQTAIAVLICPSNPSDEEPYSNYAGCHHDVEAPIDADNRGVLFLNSRVTRDDIKDGVAYTLFLGEKLIDDTDLGWLSGTPATLRNTGTRLNGARLKPGWGGASLQWLHQYETDEADWMWSDTQIDPITGETMRLNSATGEYEPVEPNSETPENAESTADVPAPASDDSKPPDDTASEKDTKSAVAGEQPELGREPNETFDDIGRKQPLKADANGLFPHSRLGGDPRNSLAVGGFSSSHSDGVNFAMGDGSVRFIGDNVSAGLMRRLANRADGATIDAREW
jgi:prepilin-type processing-associated H-X9-DG protein